MMKSYNNKLFLWLVFGSFCLEVICDEPSIGQEHYKGTYSILTKTISQVKNDKTHDSCSIDDFPCLINAASDKHGLDAIRALHKQLDDDANGDIDLSETGDFLRQDLKLDSGYEKRQKAFHQNDDMHISVKELWEAWLRSEVHNWTVQQTVEWLSACVELPQYAPNFIQHNVMGAALPRLAVNNQNYLSSLGIKDPIHKQKISLKAMDVVLFGPPKDGHHTWKDFVVILLVIGGGMGFWYSYQQNKHFKKDVNRMCKDMEALQNAELRLQQVQKELEEAKQAQEHVASEKQYLEQKLQETEADTGSLQNSSSDGEVSQLKAEIEMLRNEIHLLELKLQDRCWSPPPGLQHWLQLTHEIENKGFIKKRITAEKQLQHAREACEKLRKKRSSLVGAFVSTHGKSIDDVDRTIVEARTALNEVTQELQERVHRWKQIESLLSFNIIHNNGLPFLENTLYRGLNGRPFSLLRNHISSQDDLNDDTSSIYTPSITGPADSWTQHSGKEADSSGSEASKHDEEFSDPRHGSNNTVNFIVGGEVSQWQNDAPLVPKHTRMLSQALPVRNITKTMPSMIRSYSQDTNICQTEGHLLPTSKSSHSDTSLDYMDRRKTKKVMYGKQQTIKEQPSASNEDICSTDSSVVEDEVRRKKKKFFSFGRTKSD